MNPRDEYNSRRDQWFAKQRLAQARFTSIGNWRLATAIGAAAVAWFAFARNAMSEWWLIAPVILFIVLVVIHQRVLRRRTGADRAIRFYDQGLRRLNDDWPGHGSQGEAFRNASHIYADDLDVFGRGSLFELLSTARTAAGEKMLSDWLLAPAEFEEALARQAATGELADKLQLREDVALEGEDIRSSVELAALTKWGNAPVLPFPGWLRRAAFVSGLAGLVLLAMRLANILPLWPLILIIGLNAALTFWHRDRMARVAEGIETAAHQLGLLSSLIARLERETFEAEKLRRLRAALTTEGVPASRRIGQLDRRLELLDSSDHVILRVLEPLLLYKMQLVMAIEAWRERNGDAIGRWIEALAEFEALSCFGALHFERPEWMFPQLEQSTSAEFIATQIGHPLIAGSVSVKNDLSLSNECRLLIVSGSNMSGKSTLLRTVGLNTVLAWAGAPVCGRALRLSRLQVAASIRVSDSLQDNKSRFFAEIQKLREIVNLTTGPIPVLFLLDELLSGTNSHDRRIGAAGVVRGLLAANTIGLLTTHDLALAQLEQDAGVAARNVHFEDRMLDGKIEFDYHLSPGAVTHSNALELMRSIGLKI